MKNVFMMVYNDISKDARVLRSANALKETFRLTLYAVGKLNAEGISFIPVKNCGSVGGVSAQLRFIVGSIVECMKCKPDVIYAHDIFSAVPMMLLRWIGVQGKYIYDAHELFLAEEHPDCGIVERLQYWFERKAVRSADVVICAQEKRAQIMQEKHGLQQMPIIIQNISYLKRQGLSSLNLQDDFWRIPAFSVVYAGGFLRGRRLDCLVEAVARLGKDYKLMLIGDGPDYRRLETLVCGCGTKNIQIRHGVSYEELGDWLSCFDAGYLFYPNDTLNNRYCAPNKVFEYAGAGLPIISNKNPTVENEIEKYGIGICSDDIGETIEMIRADSSVYKANIKRYVSDHSADAEMKKLVEAVKGLY